MIRLKQKLAMFMAVATLLVAVLSFPAASAIACHSVGGGIPVPVPVPTGGVPAFSFTQPGYGGYGQAFTGGYGGQAFTQPFVQADTYGGCSSAFTQPVYAQQFVQPFLGLGLGYGGYGGLGFRQRFVVAPRVVVRDGRRFVVAGY